MKFTQIRNATLRLDYGGKRFLIDPYLAEKETYPGFPGTMNAHLSHPRVSLKTELNQILDIDAVIVTHTHLDHWDEAAITRLPKEIPVFAQHENDAALIRSQGFKDVRLLSENSQFEGITLHKTEGTHGHSDAIADLHKMLGEVSGVVFQHPKEKTLYIAGDTVWNNQVRQALTQYHPDIIVLNAGDAQLATGNSITMNCDDIKSVCEAAPYAVVIASHMEAVNHATLTRANLKEFVVRNKMEKQLLIPDDNQSYDF